MILFEKFGKLVTKQRKKKGIKRQKELAALVNMNEAAISRIESGQGCNVPKFLMICKTLDIDPKLFFKDLES